jgi:hypothetical protein
MYFESEPCLVSIEPETRLWRTRSARRNLKALGDNECRPRSDTFWAVRTCATGSVAGHRKEERACSDPIATEDNGAPVSRIKRSTRKLASYPGTEIGANGGAAGALFATIAARSIPDSDERC